MLEGYAFVGWQALSDMTANGPLLVWCADHAALIGAVIYLGRFVSKMTKTPVDDEFWANVDERFKKLKQEITQEKKDNG